MLCHIGISKYFESVASANAGVDRLTLINGCLNFGLASRNTIVSLIAESLKYEILRPVVGARSSRNPELEPTPKAFYLLTGWYLLHLSALDMLDDGGRAAWLGALGEAGLMAIGPPVAEGLVASDVIANPAPAYALFAWMDEGGILMDRLIAGIDPAADPAEERAPTNLSSISALSESLNVSRTHAGRMFSAAQAQGSLGWSGARGRSAIWVSRAFRQDYARAQAAKLAIVGRAFQRVAAESRSAIA